MQVFSCQIALPEIGKEGQARLNQSSLLAVGLGGLGSASLPYLAASGIGRIALLDFDRVEASNLPRQTLYGENDLGHFKAQAALKRLQLQYPNVQFVSLVQKVEEADLEPYDLILDGTDNAAARYAINDYCRALKKPWIYGSIQEWEGQASFFSFEGPDYRTLFSDAPTVPLPTCSMGGILGPIAGIIGSVQALEAIRYLATGRSTLEGKILLLNAKTWRTRLVSFATEEEFEIGPEELKMLIQKEPIYLIDARQPICPSLLPKDRKIVLHCPSGLKSAAVAEKLRKEGYKTYFTRHK